MCEFCKVRDEEDDARTTEVLTMEIDKLMTFTVDISYNKEKDTMSIDLAKNAGIARRNSLDYIASISKPINYCPFCGQKMGGNANGN